MVLTIPILKTDILKKYGTKGMSKDKRQSMLEKYGILSQKQQLLLKRKKKLDKLNNFYRNEM
jgi:hypothetical protein